MIGKLGMLAGRVTATEVEYLVVAAGGRGGASGSLVDEPGGGGGAGGLLSGTTMLARGVAVTVTVGAGEFSTAGNSVMGSVEAIGGGAGGAYDAAGSSGGSGGGGGRAASGTKAGGAGTSGQGNAGGDGNTEAAGRGGGAVSSGASGGSGTSSSITGTAVVYAEGGEVGGGSPPSASTGSGGRGGVRSAGDGIVVSGAGTSAANGTYAADGAANGRTRYRLGSTNYTLVWVEYAQDFGVWELRDGATALYLTDPAGNDLEPANVNTVASGASPAPSIANEETSIEATAGADGVVIIAYPDTLPALTVSGGLTFDQPSRSGYRVYRFTSGTGTITP